VATPTEAQVKAIISVDTVGWPDITPFISAADDLVVELCSDSGYDDAKMTLISTWLSAHFYTVADPRTTDEKAGSVGESFQSSVDLGFDTSHYGQMAMRIDTAGNLAALNEKIKSGKGKSGLLWLGTEREG